MLSMSKCPGSGCVFDIVRHWKWPSFKLCCLLIEVDSLEPITRFFNKSLTFSKGAFPRLHFLFHKTDVVPAGRALWCPVGVYRRPEQVGLPGDAQQQGCPPHCCDWRSTWPCRQSPAKLPEHPPPQSRCCRRSVGRRQPPKWKACGSRSCRMPGRNGGPGTPGLGWRGGRHTAARWAAACLDCPGRLHCVQGKGSPRDLPLPLLRRLSRPHPHCSLVPGAAFRLSRRLLTTSSTSLPPSRRAQLPPVYPSCRLFVCLSGKKKGGGGDKERTISVDLPLVYRENRNIDWQAKISTSCYYNHKFYDRRN